MQKQALSPGRILVTVLFALSCFSLLLFLWLSFGGSIPFKPKGFRFQVSFPQATQLALQADVRVAGVSVGKVVDHSLDPEGNRTLATVELSSQFVPIHRDARAILRQKTLLGETYVELTSGPSRRGNDVPDGGWLARGNVKHTVELDEIFQALDPRTRASFRSWQQSLSQAARGNGQNLSSVLGNLPTFVADTTDLTRVLDVQHFAVRRLVSNTGVVFDALAQNQRALRGVIVGSASVFGQTAAHDRALAQTFQIFPTFLDESKATLARLRSFALDTDPLVRDLRPVAHDLVPTLRSVRILAPDLKAFFVKLDPLIRVSRAGLPALRDVLRGATPLLARLGPFLEQLNPILDYLEQNQHRVSDFITVGAGGLASKTTSQSGGIGHYLRQFQPNGMESLSVYPVRAKDNRGNTYLPPTALSGPGLGQHLIFPNWDCNPAKGDTGANALGEKPPTEGPGGTPACFIGRSFRFKGTPLQFPHVAPNRYRPGPG